MPRSWSDAASRAGRSAHRGGIQAAERTLDAILRRAASNATAVAAEAGEAVQPRKWLAQPGGPGPDSHLASAELPASAELSEGHAVLLRRRLRPRRRNKQKAAIVQKGFGARMKGRAIAGAGSVDLVAASSHVHRKPSPETGQISAFGERPAGLLSSALTNGCLAAVRAWRDRLKAPGWRRPATGGGRSEGQLFRRAKVPVHGGAFSC